MTIRAVAFREQDNGKRIAELFGVDEHELFGGKTIGRCSKCLKEFQVILALADDEDNPRYFRELEKMISDNCSSGEHAKEYIFQTRP